MSKDLSEHKDSIHVAEVVHHGEKIILPDGMSIDDAIRMLDRKRSYLEEEIRVHRTFNVFPYDGANALAACLTHRFGWAAAEAEKTFFGKRPPQMLTIDVGPDEKRNVPWGKFSIPGSDSGYLNTGADWEDGCLRFSLSATITRKDENIVSAIFDDVEHYLKFNSIYAGQAIKIRFLNDNGNQIPMPEPKFLNTAEIKRESLIYSDDVTDAIETNLFTPIERIEDCISNGIPVKRGVLLGGPYGTGKTLAAHVASKLAVDNGVTFLYVPRSDELAVAIEFAKQYQEHGCVIFCEDIDRAMSGERSVKMDDILNILDGIDTKSSRIITVLTTNHLENINVAMLRPGRLDAIINVTPPDAKACEKLIRLYGGGTIDPETDLTAASKLLSGAIPAVVAEVVKRAKLYQIQLQEPGTSVGKITGEAVLRSAKTMQAQISLLEEQSKPKASEPTFNEVMGGALSHAMNGSREAILSTKKMVDDIHKEVI